MATATSRIVSRRRTMAVMMDTAGMMGSSVIVAVEMS